LDQLAFLTAYAAELFNDILRDSNSIAERMILLGHRADNMTGYVSQLEEFVRSTDPNAFKSVPGCPFKVLTARILLFILIWT
jgi:hypothetical protein